jgi:hypothetical protein
MNILNLTQNCATPEQVAQGVYEPEASLKAKVQQLLTFDELPNDDELISRTVGLVRIAVEQGAKAVLIGGAPYLMPMLHDGFTVMGIKIMYSFSKRTSVEKLNPDGTVTKTMVFKHEGFVEY